MGAIAFAPEAIAFGAKRPTVAQLCQELSHAPRYAADDLIKTPLSIEADTSGSEDPPGGREGFGFP